MTVTLTIENLTQLERVATQYNVDANTLFDEALKRQRRYLEERKIEREKQAFLQNHADWKQTYLGQIVAVHHGIIIDTDADMNRLHQRIRQQYGREAILIRRVEEEPDRPLMMRSPRLDTKMQ